MFKIIKLLFLILVFEKSHAIHHHKRISDNFLIDKTYLWNNRIILYDVDSYESEKIREDSLKRKCEISNRKLKILIKKNNSFIDIEDSKKKFSLNPKFKFKVTLIGIDGEIKFQSNDLGGLEKYFTIIDNMSIRKTEAKNDIICN